MKKVIYLILIFWNLHVYSQDVASASLKWTVDHITNLATGDEFAFNCTFETNGGSTIKWIQKNGSHVSTIQITGSEGYWPNVNETGKIIYSVVLDELAGTMVFERSANGLTITADFSMSNPNGMKNRFRISSVTQN